MSDSDGFSHRTCKWFNAQKAFGFISLPEGGMDIFVHANQLRKSGILRCLLEGEKLKFHIATGDKGQYATDISVVTAEKIMQMRRYCVASIGFPDRYFWTFRGLLRYWRRYRRVYHYTYNAFKWDGTNWNHITVLSGAFHG